MITLEQIRLLESKITRALELIRVLKDENSTLRKGLESAQKRMKELETLVDGFKTDQKEIESVIVRTLHNLDELEETAGTGERREHAGAGRSGALPSASVARWALALSAGTTAQAAPVRLRGQGRDRRAAAAEPRGAGRQRIPANGRLRARGGHEPPLQGRAGHF